MKHASCSHAAILIMALIVKAPGQVSSAPLMPPLVQSPGLVAPAPAPSPAPQPPAPAATSAITQSGLLPLFAIDVRIDPAWIDGSTFPSASPQFPHNGVSDALQQAWDLLKTDGFNVIRIPVNVDDKQAVARVANICVWAKTNSVLLIPVLTSNESRGTVATANPMADFVPALIAKLRSGDGQQFGAYSQIAYYQISDRMNNPGFHGGRSGQQLQEYAVRVAEGLRKAEIQALQGTNVQPTPIMVSATFDYELIRQGAINGISLDAPTQEKAVAALKDFLTPLAGSPNIDALAIEYLPRSISAGDVDGFAPLLRSLKTVAPGKQLALVTGFSTAFHNPEEQRQFLIVTTGNLADFHASDGAGTHFLGAIFREGLAGQWTSPTPEPDVSQWQWQQRAKELQDMWSHGKNSPDLKWWLEKTEANLGLVQMPASGSGATVTALPGLQVFQQIANAAQAAQAASAAQTAPPATVPVSPQGTPSQPPPGSLTTAFPRATVTQPVIAMNAVAPASQGQSQTSQLVFNLLSQFATQLTTVFISKLNGGGATNIMNTAATSQSVPLAASPMPFTPSPTPDPDSGIPPTSAVGAQPVANTAQPDPAIPQPAAQSAYVAPTAPSPRDGAVNSSAGLGPASNPTATSTKPEASANSGLTPPSTTPPADSGSVATPAQPVSTASPVSPPSVVTSTNAAGDNGSLPAAAFPIPQISYFGVSNNEVGLANQTPPVVLQLTNPSNAVTAPVQVELRLDGVSMVTDQIGPMLPKQSRSVPFSPLSTPAGSHTLDIIMSGSQGAASPPSATLLVQVSLPPSVVPANGPTAATTAFVPLGVRTVLPAIVVAAPPVTPVPVRAAPLLVPAKNAGTTTPVPAVRTISPRIAPVASTAAANPVKPGPSSTPATLPVRTIAPRTPTSSSPTAATPATTLRPAVRTIQPPQSSTAAAAPTPVRPGPRTIMPPTAATSNPLRGAVLPSNPQKTARNPLLAATRTVPASSPNCQPASNGGNTGTTTSSTQANKNTAPCTPARK